MPSPIEVKAIEGILDDKDETPAERHADDDAPLRALVFDSYYDPFRGIIIFVRVEEGTIRRGDSLTFIQHGKEVEVISVGINTPKEVEKEFSGKKPRSYRG